MDKQDIFWEDTTDKLMWIDPLTKMPVDLDTVLSATYAPLGNARRSILLRPVHDALIAGGITNLLHVGHSVTEGHDVTTAGQRWTDVLLDSVRAKIQPPGVTGGWGYVAARPVYTDTQRANFAYTGTISNSIQGITTQAANMTASATATLVFTGTAIRIHYTQYPGAPTATITIDAVGKTGIAAAGADNYGAYVDYTGLTAAAHTIVITNPGAGSFYLQGALVMNGDEARGVRSFNGGYSGLSASNFVSATNTPVAWAAVSPSLVTLQFEINEYRGNATSASYETALRSLVDKIRTKVVPNPSIVLVTSYEPLHGGTPVEPFSAYRAATARVATDRQCHLVDLVSAFGTGVLAGSGLMVADQIHPSASGHAAIAALLTIELMGDLA